MKVPVYRSQTGLPQRTGAGQLTVQASPAAFGAVGAAQSELGQTVEKQMLGWTEAFLKTERATAQAEQMTKARKRISDLDANVRLQSVKFWTHPTETDEAGDAKQFGYFGYSAHLRKKLNDAATRQLNAIPDRAVRQRMASALATSNENAMTQINAVLRSKYMDYSKTQIEMEFSKAANEIALMKEGKAKEDRIEKALGEAAYFHGLAPFIGNNYWRKQVKEFGSRVGEIAVRQQLTLIKDSAGAVEMIRQLSSPEEGDEFKADVLRMKPGTRQRLIEQLESRADRLLNKEQNDEMRGLRDGDYKNTRLQNTTHDLYHNQITTIRKAVADGHEPGDPAWPKIDGDDLIMPSGDDIQRSTTSPKQKAALHQLLAGEDRIYNTGHVTGLKLQIYDAVTSDDLDQIQDGFRKDRAENYIGGRAFEELTREVKDMRDNTPEAEERKIYHNLIKEAMKTRNMQTVRVAQHERKAAAVSASYASIGGQKFYLEQVGRGVRPAEAFWNVVTKFQDDKAVVVKNEVKTLPDNFLPQEVMENIKLMTPAHIDTAIAALRVAARGEEIDPKLLGMTQKELGEMQRGNKLDKSKRMTVRQLVALEAKLNFLRTFAETNKPPPPNGDGNGGGGGDSDAPESKFKKLLDQGGENAVELFNSAVDWIAKRYE